MFARLFHVGLRLRHFYIRNRMELIYLASQFCDGSILNGPSIEKRVVAEAEPNHMSGLLLSLELSVLLGLSGVSILRKQAKHWFRPSSCGDIYFCDWMKTFLWYVNRSKSFRRIHSHLSVGFANCFIISSKRAKAVDKSSSFRTALQFNYFALNNWFLPVWKFLRWNGEVDSPQVKLLNVCKIIVGSVVDDI